MTAALVGGSAALLVSAIGAVAQARIARRGREANAALAEEHRASAKEAAAEQGISELFRCSETLRNRCWELAVNLRAVADGQVKPEHERLLSLEREFHAQSRSFLDAWGGVQVWTEPRLVPAVRQARHECMIALDTIFVRFAVALSDPSESAMTVLATDVDEANKTLAAFIDLVRHASASS